MTTKARFEFKPLLWPETDTEVPSGPIGPSINATVDDPLTRINDKAYPRINEIFQDNEGNLYVYKYFSSTKEHKYVRMGSLSDYGEGNEDPFKNLDAAAYAGEDFTGIEPINNNDFIAYTSSGKIAILSSSEEGKISFIHNPVSLSSVSSITDAAGIYFNSYLYISVVDGTSNMYLYRLNNNGVLAGSFSLLYHSTSGDILNVLFPFATDSMLYISEYTKIYGKIIAIDTSDIIYDDAGSFSGLGATGSSSFKVCHPSLRGSNLENGIFGYFIYDAAAYILKFISLSISFSSPTTVSIATENIVLTNITSFGGYTSIVGGEKNGKCKAAAYIKSSANVLADITFFNGSVCYKTESPSDQLLFKGIFDASLELNHFNLFTEKSASIAGVVYEKIDSEGEYQVRYYNSLGEYVSSYWAEASMDNFVECSEEKKNIITLRNGIFVFENSGNIRTFNDGEVILRSSILADSMAAYKMRCRELNTNFLSSNGEEINGFSKVKDSEISTLHLNYENTGEVNSNILNLSKNQGSIDGNSYLLSVFNQSVLTGAGSVAEDNSSFFVSTDINIGYNGSVYTQDFYFCIVDKEESVRTGSISKFYKTIRVDNYPDIITGNILFKKLCMTEDALVLLYVTGSTTTTVQILLYKFSIDSLGNIEYDSLQQYTPSGKSTATSFNSSSVKTVCADSNTNNIALLIQTYGSQYVSAHISLFSFSITCKKYFEGDYGKEGEKVLKNTIYLDVIAEDYVLNTIAGFSPSIFSSSYIFGNNSSIKLFGNRLFITGFEGENIYRNAIASIPLEGSTVDSNSFNSFNVDSIVISYLMSMSGYNTVESSEISYCYGINAFVPLSEDSVLISFGSTTSENPYRNYILIASFKKATAENNTMYMTGVREISNNYKCQWNLASTRMLVSKYGLVRKTSGNGLALSFGNSTMSETDEASEKGLHYITPKMSSADTTLFLSNLNNGLDLFSIKGNYVTFLLDGYIYISRNIAGIASLPWINGENINAENASFGDIVSTTSRSINTRTYDINVDDKVNINGVTLSSSYGISTDDSIDIEKEYKDKLESAVISAFPYFRIGSYPGSDITRKNVHVATAEETWCVSGIAPESASSDDPPIVFIKSFINPSQLFMELRFRTHAIRLRFRVSDSSTLTLSNSKVHYGKNTYFLDANQSSSALNVVNGNNTFNYLGYTISFTWNSAPTVSSIYDEYDVAIQDIIVSYNYLNGISKVIFNLTNMITTIVGVYSTVSPAVLEALNNFSASDAPASVWIERNSSSASQSSNILLNYGNAVKIKDIIFITGAFYNEGKLYEHSLFVYDTITNSVKRSLIENIEDGTADIYADGGANFAIPSGEEAANFLPFIIEIGKTDYNSSAAQENGNTIGTVIPVAIVSASFQKFTRYYAGIFVANVNFNSQTRLLNITRGADIINPNLTEIDSYERYKLFLKNAEVEFINGKSESSLSSTLVLNDTIANNPIAKALMIPYISSVMPCEDSFSDLSLPAARVTNGALFSFNIRRRICSFCREYESGLVYSYTEGKFEENNLYHIFMALAIDKDIPLLSDNETYNYTINLANLPAVSGGISGIEAGQYCGLLYIGAGYVTAKTTGPSISSYRWGFGAKSVSIMEVESINNGIYVYSSVLSANPIISTNMASLVFPCTFKSSIQLCASVLLYTQVADKTITDIKTHDALVIQFIAQTAVEDNPHITSFTDNFVLSSPDFNHYLTVHDSLSRSIDIYAIMAFFINEVQSYYINSKIIFNNDPANYGNYIIPSMIRMTRQYATGTVYNLAVDNIGGMIFEQQPSLSDNASTKISGIMITHTLGSTSCTLSFISNTTTSLINSSYSSLNTPIIYKSIRTGIDNEKISYYNSLRTSTGKYLSAFIRFNDEKYAYIFFANGILIHTLIESSAADKSIFLVYENSLGFVDWTNGNTDIIEGKTSADWTVNYSISTSEDKKIICRNILNSSAPIIIDTAD